ncbi:MAG: 50S ribosomal protein L22 [Halobacteriaceae archaeon]
MGISYSVETDPDRHAKAMLREEPISLKHSKALARELRGKTLAKGRAYLEAVRDGDQSVPFKQHNSGVGHRSDIEGWDAGRFPEKAATAMLGLLDNGANNATQAGFDAEAMEIEHLAPHKVDERRGRQPRARGRVDEWNTTLCDVELVLAAPEEGEN